MRNLKRTINGFAIIASLSMTSQAIGQSAVNTSSIKRSTKLDKILDTIKPSRIGYWSQFAGPQIGGSGSPVDEFGVEDKGSVNTWNQVSFGWQLSKATRLVINPRFEINHNSKEARRVNPLDPVIGINTTWFKSGKLSFGGGINTIMPFARTTDTKTDNLVLNPGGFQVVNYQVNSAFSVGSWVWGRVRFFDGTSPEDEDRVQYMFAPIATYNFSDSLGMSVFYQFDGDAKNNYDFTWDTDQTLNLSMRYTLNKYLTLEPFITVFQEANFSPSRANINMFISGRFL
ncbi:MAG: hypothetical protein CME69_10690 [Halobacteriovorax sp.]|nr:hypothetical protein [Halobacteriovorax sp.]